MYILYRNFRIWMWRSQHLIALCTMKICLNYPPGFLHPNPFPNTSIIKDKRILTFCGKIT